jgi:hypothetical protein
MLEMTHEDLTDFLWHLYNAFSSYYTDSEWKWRMFHLRQAYYCLTCIWYGHGARDNCNVFMVYKEQRVFCNLKRGHWQSHKFDLEWIE